MSNIEKAFEKFNRDIRLSETQENDAVIKYDWVCKKIHNHFLENIEYNWNTKFLFWSYKNKTNITPFTEDQDVDVLFKIPKETYDKYNSYSGNWQSALLQEIRKILLNSKYSLSEKPKAWGKIILIKTSDWKHNVELLPAFEKEDKSFLIPNTEDWWTWDLFDPRKDIEIFKESNKETNWLTASLIRMVKSWRNNNSTLILKSYQIEKYVINFLENYAFLEKQKIEIVYNFFEYLKKNCNKDQEIFVLSAISNLKKAFNFIDNNKEKEALEEIWKIFWSKFPITLQKIYESDENVNVINNAPKPWLLV